MSRLVCMVYAPIAPSVKWTTGCNSPVLNVKNLLIIRTNGIKHIKVVHTPEWIEDFPLVLIKIHPLFQSSGDWQLSNIFSIIYFDQKCINTILTRFGNINAKSSWLCYQRCHIQSIISLVLPLKNPSASQSVGCGDYREGAADKYLLLTLLLHPLLWETFPGYQL